MSEIGINNLWQYVWNGPYDSENMSSISCHLDNIAIYSDIAGCRKYVDLLKSTRESYAGRVVVEGELVPNDRYDYVENMKVEFDLDAYEIDFAEDELYRGLWFRGDEEIPVTPSGAKMKICYKIEGEHFHFRYKKYSRNLLECTSKFLQFHNIVERESIRTDTILSCTKTVEELCEMEPSIISLEHIREYAAFYIRHLSSCMEENCAMMLSLQVIEFINISVIIS